MAKKKTGPKVHKFAGKYYQELTATEKEELKKRNSSMGSILNIGSRLYKEVAKPEVVQSVKQKENTENLKKKAEEAKKMYDAPSNWKDGKAVKPYTHFIKILNGTKNKK